MINQNAQKLAHLLGDVELAGALVAAGLDTPARIKAADKGKLEKALDKDKLAKVQKWLDKKGKKK